MAATDWRASYLALSAKLEAVIAENQAWRAKHQALRTENELLKHMLDTEQEVAVRFLQQGDALRRDVEDLKADLVMADQVNQALHGKVQELRAKYEVTEEQWNKAWGSI